MDFTSIFDGKALTLEEFQAKTKDLKLADLSGGEYVAKGKFSDQAKELESLRTQLAEKDQTIANLEKASGDAEKVQAELDKYKQAEAERKKAEREAQADQILTAADSKISGLIPRMPEISVIMVEPYHIHVWMKITTPLATALLLNNSIGASMNPNRTRKSLTGPMGYPKNPLNRIAMVAAVMIFGI